MKRYWTYIFIALFVGLLTTSCIEELDMPQSVTTDDTETILVPRVTRFANQYVTKSAYGTKETTITSLAVLVFNSDGNLVFLQENSNLDGASPVTLNKSRLNLASATVVMFANMSIDHIKNSENKSIRDNKSTLTLTGLEGYTYHIPENQTFITDITSNFAGFPMVGVKGVDLTPTTTQQGQIEVSLKILFAKISLEIAVENGTENTLNPTQFTISSATITNLATATPLAMPAEAGEKPKDFLGNEKNEEPLESADYTDETFVDTSSEHKTKTITSTSKTVSAGSTSDKYIFYIAENRYNHGDTKGVYPSDSWLTSDLYDSYKQQYKPKLAEKTGGEGLPTYITLTGVYKDYRSTEWNVTYKVYLGKNNYDNFQIDRNSEYINTITIKGIRNNDGYGAGEVWLDHRVDVSLGTQPSGTGSADDCVTITRETLIDSHIEVRPLRVKWGTSMVNGEEVEEYDGVRLYLPTDEYGNLINWIGIEKFTGDNCQDGATYCFNVDPSTDTSFSTGKRKYFTTDLINQLQNMSGDLGVKTDANGRKFLDMYNGHCAWIYFDENTTSEDRPAEIKLDFYVGDDVLETEVYIIKQRCLQTIGNYVVESYEEYLHSYDSVDKYNLSTSPVDYTQQGLAWGLVNERISEDILVTTLANLGDWTPQRYDYFHSADGSNYNTYSNLSLLPDNPKKFGTGIIFTDRASAKKKISIKDMGTIPSSAYQYCLSKNKFNEDPDGNHTLDIHWYLPDVYELQNVLQASISDNASVDFSPDANYWSSQPAFTGTTYIDENDSEARAVSIKGITPVSRSIQNRIRCFYSNNAINADMKERIPDGLGGNYLFIMKGKQSDGYFKNLLEGKKKDYPGVIETDYLYNDSSFPYPTKDNSYGASNPEFEYIVDKNKNNETIEGFTVNPQENWKKQVFDFGTLFGSQVIYETEYYTTLATYPGLTDKTLEKMGASIFDEKRTFLGIEYTYRDLAELANIDLDAFLLVEAYRPTDTTPPSYITDTQTLTSSSVIDLRAEELPQGESLKPLNDKLKISFGAANSQGNKPDFEYYELVSKTEQTNIRYWNPPVYTGTTHELNPESESFSQTGSGSETGVSTGTSSIQQASTNDAKQVAFDGTRNVSTLTHVVDGAYPKAKKDAEVKLDEILKNYPESDGWVHGRYEYTPLSWDQKVPNIQWSEPEIKTTAGWFSTYTSKVTITCTVTVTATVAITKPGSETLYLQTTGTGCWGDPIPGEPVPAGSGVTSDELRIYSGNSFTISCTDPKYEITKVRVYFSGSNQIEDGDQDDYFARFVDGRVDLSTPITGDESSHLFGMEYNEADGWHQWSGSGRQSVTLNLADYKLTTNYDLGNMTWEDFISGNWGAAVTYDYEYSAASKNLNKYIVVDRIEVKCTPKANVATE